MQWFEYLIIVFAILFVISVIFLNILLKKHGKSLNKDCSNNCHNCKKMYCCSSKQLIKEYHEMNEQ